MEKVTWDNLPHSVTMLTKVVSELKTLLIKKQEQVKSEPSEQLLTIKEAASLLHLSVSTLYSKNSRGELPNVCKQGKRLYFSKQSLIDWVKEGRNKSSSEIEQEADAYLSNKRKGLK